MKTEEIRGIAAKKGLTNYDLFVDFITERFPNEAHESYVIEWVDRFLSGNPVAYMDIQSKKIYIKLVSKGVKNVK